MTYFIEAPSIPVLQSLARGSLKQNLLRALRLWVWLRVLYADPNDERTELHREVPDPFTFAEWRDSFFSDSHPSDEKAPVEHDLACACAKTTQDWLLLLEADLDLTAWKVALHQQDGLPSQFEMLLNQRLFGVTRRTLDEDLRILAKLGWVKRQSRYYARVRTFPHRLGATAQPGDSHALLQPDLAAIATTLTPSINGHQRFFLHVEYVVPTTATDRVDDWQAQLKQIWEQTPVPPLVLTFYSAKLNATCTTTVYPVCVYYAQRGPYLCAWGQVPENLDAEMDWRNYRLDRIKAMRPLTWRDSAVPKRLRQAFQHCILPTPDRIQEHMAEAWGFDFYQPADTLLLRFDRDFAKRYIDTSVRHETFTGVRYAQAKAMVLSNEADPAIHKTLLKLLHERSPDDAYYTAQYRRHDPNILLRLRAWRPHIEILLPWDLRQQTAAEVQREYQFYWNL